jgi:hypothetical protein
MSRCGVTSHRLLAEQQFCVSRLSLGGDANSKWLAVLARLPWLETLILTACPMKPPALKPLHALRFTLRHLVVVSDHHSASHAQHACVSMDDAGVRVLGALEALESLELVCLARCRLRVSIAYIIVLWDTAWPHRP